MFDFPSIVLISVLSIAKMDSLKNRGENLNFTLEVWDLIKRDHQSLELALAVCLISQKSSHADGLL